MTHRVVVEEDEDGDPFVASFTCDASEGSECRSWCTVCEETCTATPILGPVEQIAQAPVDGHLYAPIPSCRVVDWLSAGDRYDREELHVEDECLRPGAEPIVEDWDGDCYVWRYAEPEPEPAYPGHP